MRNINVYITLCRLAEQGRERGESPADGHPLLPHVLRGRRHHDLQVIIIMVVRDCLSCLTLCVTSLAHMLPDVRDVLEVSLEHGTFPDTGLPVPEILVLAGFLFIYTLEQLMHMLLVWTGNIEVRTLELER